MRHHIDKDIDVTEQEHQEAQKVINGHSTFWSRILNISCEKEEFNPKMSHQCKNSYRSKNNLLTENNKLPSLFGLRKDHKHTANENKGPSTRPVCGAHNHYNKKLTHLLSTILIKVWKEEPENCMNTEELLAEFDDIKAQPM